MLEFAKGLIILFCVVFSALLIAILIAGPTPQDQQGQEIHEIN